MAVRIILAVELTDTLAHALTVPEASSHVLSASDGREYLASVHVAQAELVIHAHGGNELRSQFAVPEGNGGVAVRLRLTTDIAVHRRSNQASRQFVSIV
jgi:hypothetical protein